MKKFGKLFSLFFFITAINSLYSQTSTAGLYSNSANRTSEEGFAAEEFRRGVQAFYRGSFNEAVLQFEKAISYMPEDNLILEWLGKAYYHAGLEGTAIQNWQRASDAGYGGVLLQNKIEIVRERRISEELIEAETRYTEAGVFPGTYEGNFIFSGPISVLPNNNGTFWILCYGSNEFILMNVNGTVINRVTGPINGFDRPVDMIRLHDGSILVSESAGDRLSLFSEKGKFLKYFGSKGRGVGQLVGPQYMAQDNRKNVYVSDYGNSRVSVFDKDGNGLFYFGKAQSGFEGLKGPTGIAALGESIYVADDIKGCIYEFDQAGNFKRMVVEPKTFKHPESMKVWQNYLVVCDSNKVISVNPDTGATFMNVSTGNAPSRVTSAVPDVNGNVLVTDIKTNEVYVMAKMQELVGGLFVQIERINASKFPEVIVDLKVENRHRLPVVGLKENNFYFTEDKRPVSKLKYLGNSSDTEFADIAVIIDRSSYTQPYQEQVNTIVRDISSSMNGKGNFLVISAGRIPAVEFKGNPKGCAEFSCEGLKTPVSSVVPMDLALRLASNELINTTRKKAIILVSAGKVTVGAFEKYSLAESSAYMNNNSIYCLGLRVNQGGADEELNYIVNTTKGDEYYVFRPEGLSSVLKEIIDIPSGVYSFSYTSSLSTNFGEKYLPVEVEAYLLNRSGRDETGYFAPLQ